MAPPRIYKSGIHDYHLSINEDYREDFDDLCHKKRKSRNQYINDLIIQELERNSIAENDLPGENVSCLAHTPFPLQHKITDIQHEPEQDFRMPTEQELITHLKTLRGLPQIGKLQGDYSRGLQTIKNWMQKVKIDNLRVS